MMDPNTVAIPIAFVLIAALLCLLLIGTKWKWWWKLALFATVLPFCFFIWSAIVSYQGWPTTQQTPQKALLLQAIVREPEPDNPGAIYLWLLPLSDEVHDTESFLQYAGSLGEPRAYRLPYTREMHQMVEKAQAKMREGKPVVLERGRKPGTGDGDGEGQPGEPGDEEGGREGSNGQRPGGGYGGHEQEYQMYELPPPAPPRKTSE